MVVRSGGPRWSLAAGAASEVGHSTANSTANSTAANGITESAALEYAGILLERWAVASRVSVAAEQPVGGFAGQYRVLSALAEAGSCQRVYAVDGAGGAQFAVNGAVDALREVSSDLQQGRFLLSAIDPAQPFGTLLSWPDTKTSEKSNAPRPARRAGALVLLDGAALRAYVEPSGSSLATWAVESDDAASALLSDIARAREPMTNRPRALLTAIDGISLLDGAAISSDSAVRWNVAITAAGFTPTPRGWRWPTYA
jgi:ATP-dependent Lhr-like helicase